MVCAFAALVSVRLPPAYDAAVAKNPTRSIVSWLVKPLITPVRAELLPASVHCDWLSKSIALKPVKFVAVRLPATTLPSFETEANSRVPLPPTTPP